MAATLRGALVSRSRLTIAWIWLFISFCMESGRLAILHAGEQLGFYVGLAPAVRAASGWALRQPSAMLAAPPHYVGLCCG